MPRAKRRKRTKTEHGKARSGKGQSRIPESMGQGLLKPIDKKILNVIVSNGRMANIEIAKNIGSSEATVRRRIQNLIDNNFIDGFSITVNYKKLGVSFIRVILFLEVEGDSITEVVDSFISKKEVYFIHQTVSNRFNVIGGMVFPHLEAMEKFFDTLHHNEKVLNIEYSIITEDYVSYPCGMDIR